MRAVVLETYGEPLEIREVPEPDCADHGVVVRTEACGVCRSDWHAWKGHDEVESGQILGHEPAGVVVEVGDDVETVTEGDRIAIPFSLGDGSCPHCLSGHGNVCENSTGLGFGLETQGAFAEYVHVPYAEYNAQHLPEDIAYRDAAALGCRYMTAYHGVVHRAGAGPGDWVAVHGCGGVGLSGVQLAKAVGASVVAVDIREEALEMADALGADATVDASAVDDVPGAVRAETDGGAHVSVDALGIAETCRNSVRSLSRRGRHVQLGLTTDAEGGEVSLPTDHIAMRELTVYGSRGMPQTRYPELFRLIAGGNLDPGALVTREVSLDEVPDRLAAMDDYATVGIEVCTAF